MFNNISSLLAQKGLHLAACWRRESWSPVSENKSRSQVPTVSSRRGKSQKGKALFVTLKLSSWPPGRKTKRSIWPSVYLTGSVPGIKKKERAHTQSVNLSSILQEVRNGEVFLGDNPVYGANLLFHNKIWQRICIYFYFSFQACSSVCGLQMASLQADRKSPNQALQTKFISL